MPSPMVERIAIEIAKQNGIAPHALATNLPLYTQHGLTLVPAVADTYDSPRPAWTFFIPHAMAALTALREPTEQMLSVLSETIGGDKATPECWCAAIDEAFR